MPPVKLIRRFGPFGAALTVWDAWRRLSPAQQRWVSTQVRKHGPRIAKQAVQQALDAQKKRRR